MRLAVLFIAACSLHAQNWFQFNNGDTTCRASTVQSSPFRFTFLCENARGATGGSYTAVGSTTADVIQFGLSGTTPENTASCLIAVNTTAVAVVIGSFGSVAANSVAWQCAQGVSGSTPTGGSLSLKGKK
jgi:hypothetical protein